MDYYQNCQDIEVIKSYVIFNNKSISKQDGVSRKTKE
jgi:hypothetical protein